MAVFWLLLEVLLRGGLTPFLNRERQTEVYRTFERLVLECQPIGNGRRPVHSKNVNRWKGFSMTASLLTRRQFVWSCGAGVVASTVLAKSLAGSSLFLPANT